MGINASFAGDDQVCVPYFFVQVEKVSDQIESRDERRTAKRHQAERDPACGTGSGGGCEIRTKLLLCKSVDVDERFFERRNICGRGSFLWREDLRASRWTEQWICHIAGRNEGHVVE